MTENGTPCGGDSPGGGAASPSPGEEPSLKKDVLREIKRGSRGFSSMAAWRRHSKRNEVLYRKALHGDFLFEAKKFFRTVQRAKGYWTRERCAAAARECATRGELKRRFPTALDRIKDQKWEEEMLSHMPANARRIWTDELIEEERRKHRTSSIWRILSPGSFRAARRLREETKTAAVGPEVEQA